MDDQIVIRRVRDGEIEAYALLVRKYHRQLLSFIFRLVGEAQLAEDIGQEVFFAVYRELDRFETERGVPFGAWLFIVARNRCVTALRRRGRRRTFGSENLDRLPAPGRSPEESLLQREELEALAATVAGLPEPYRSAILLSLEGATLEEIADRCGIPTATVKSRLFRARAKIRLAMHAYFGGFSHEKEV